jgi:transcriptional regulator with XRE-family HTH domain
MRRELQKALAEEAQKRGLTQSDLALAIGVNRSVISRELRGHKDLSLSRVAELALALGRRPVFELVETVPAQAAASLEPEDASALKV